MNSVLRALGLLIVAGSVVACGPTPTPVAPPAPQGQVESPADGRAEAVVLRVVDGDTLVVDLTGVSTKIRLLNVDAPETKDPNEAVQCLGPEASAFLTTLLPAGTAVELEYDGEKLDRYGRTLAGVWLRESLVNAEIARAGLGAPVQFNGQVKFLPPVEAAAAEARQAMAGAYAADVDCALPGQVDQALSTINGIADPSKKTSKAYAASINSLVAASKAATEVAGLAKTAGGASGAAAWAFHDAVRPRESSRIDVGIEVADGRLKALRATMKTLEMKEAAERKRKLQREKAERERAAERKRAAAERRREQREAEREAERERESYDSGDHDSSSSGDSNPDGYTGRRCYAPGGKTWRPC